MIEKFLPSSEETILRLQISATVVVLRYLSESGMREVQFSEDLPARTLTHIAIQVSSLNYEL